MLYAQLYYALFMTWPYRVCLFLIDSSTNHQASKKCSEAVST